ncbi:MAG TPA: hypothetical protein VJL90_10800, partial [Pseudorhodoplanes sp.]|nr:hypothetical protein [Pseudorhodoplanes sp.]
AQSIEPVDCELYRDPSMADQLYITDSGRRYYVVFGKNPHEQLVLMRADGSDRVKLPIWQGTVSASQFRLFDGAFLLYKSDLVGAGEVIGHAPDSFTLWRETNCWPVWRVDPRSGATNRFCIPHGYWAAPRKSGGILTLLPTKAGYFFTYFVGRDDSGLYRLRDGVVQKIAKGYFLNPVVSPSGCRVAFKFIPNDNAYRSFTPDAPTITAIDLCLSD